jgi:N-acetyl sugar amidotransferase
MGDSRPYQECSRCILDTADYPDISFDEWGVCSICHIYDELARRTLAHGEAGQHRLDGLLASIRAERQRGGREYDCLLGVSGGVDSSYVAFLAKQWSLRPLVVHVDNGWNTDLAVSNIESLLTKLGFDLYTGVLDWEEMRDFQLAFIKAHVLDIDLPFDNAFMAVLYRLAAKHRIRFILSGHNTATEGYLPPTFTHYKLDSLNLRHIHRLFGTVRLRTFPIIGPVEQWVYETVRGIRFYTPLDWLDYNKAEARQLITAGFGWRDYGGKHYENIFTRFYQGYILPRKFGVDKRKSHFSTLVCSGQLTRAEAAAEFKATEPYPDSSLLQTDREFFIKKLGLTAEAFASYIAAPAIPHTRYRSWINVFNSMRPYYRIVRRLFGGTRPAAKTASCPCRRS